MIFKTNKNSVDEDTGVKIKILRKDVEIRQKQICFFSCKKIFVESNSLYILLWYAHRMFILIGLNLLISVLFHCRSSVFPSQQKERSPQ